MSDEEVTDDAMSRSEEHLEVSTEEHEAGRAPLRKFVVTEEQTVTVPVSHQEVRLEREPITDANREAAMTGDRAGHRCPWATDTVFAVR